MNKEISIMKPLIVFTFLLLIELPLFANTDKETESLYSWHLADMPDQEKYWYDELQILKDKEGEISFEQINVGQYNFQPNTTKQNYENDVVYWVKLILYGHPDKRDYYLFNLSHDNDNRLSWLEIDAYLLHENGQIDQRKTGLIVPKNEKSIPTADNLIRFSIEQGERAVLYVRLDGVKKIFKPSFIQFGVVTEDWWGHKNISAWKSGSFLAVLAIQFFYFLLLFFIEKERIHFYFSLTMLGLFIEYGSRFLNDFSMSLGYVELIGYSGIPIFLIGLTKYTAYYFKLPRHSLLSKKILPAFIYLCFFCLLLLYITFGFYQVYDIPIYFVFGLVVVMTLAVFLGAGLCIYTAFSSGKQLKVYRKFYLLSFSPILMMLLIFIGFTIVTLTGVVQDLGRFTYLLAYAQDISLFFMMVLLALSNGYRANREKEEKQMAIQRNIISQQQTKLYTNITHEFRTPLTVILGMVEQIKKKPDQAAEMIRRNGINLLNLINQILDLSKLESGNLKLNLKKQNVIGFLLYISESFQSLAESKDIVLTTYTEVDHLEMDFDEEKLQQIIFNLLSNAVKFTQSKGKIILHIVKIKGIETDGHLLQIKVKDNGVGISKNELELIFDRFYQVNESSSLTAQGTGVGLALTKELVKLMGGEISVKSEFGKGSEFKVLLPITLIAPLVSNQYQFSDRAPLAVSQLQNKNISEQLSGEDNIADSNKPILLVIEDNPDVLAYIEVCLDENYQILKASNGQEGIDVALEKTPDIIISDVMMPEKNGYEVCAVLKKDKRSSHIPIILLTAKYTTEDKIEGLTQGADAYLTKPFNKEELLVRLEKLIEIRKLLQIRYGDLDIRSQENLKISTSEDLFLSKFRQLVETNISDDGFGIPQLCREMGMSRSQIYRKLTALTGKSTSHYIRSIRLYKAKELLKTTDLNVSEVAFDVGFTDPLYFSRVFSQEFGYPPSKA